MAGTWTYGGKPTSNPLDACRLLIGDTDTTNQLMFDAEIISYLVQYSSDPLPAAADCLDALASKFAFQVTTGNLKLHVAASERSKAFAARALVLRGRVTRLAQVFVGGLSQAAKDGLNANMDAVPPHATVGMDDYFNTNDYDKSRR